MPSTDVVLTTTSADVEVYQSPVRPQGVLLLYLIVGVPSAIAVLVAVVVTIWSGIQ